MPGEDPPASPHPKRPGMPHRHSSQSSHVSHSPAESHGHRPHPHPSHKTQRHHVVGHGRRNPSFHRSLSKIKITPYDKPNDDEEPLTPKVRQQQQHQQQQKERPGSSASQNTLVPPSPARPNMKRNNTSLHLPRTQSHTALKKNHSSGQLTRLGSSKHIAHSRTPSHQPSQSQRPEIRRSNSQPQKRARSPAPKAQAVHFDVGDDDEDDGEEMEGVDDQWTEESASASPNTTRDNTRNNTRQNSIVLDPYQNPYAQKRPEEKPPDSSSGSDTDGPPSPNPSTLAIRTKDFASNHAATSANTMANKSSYNEQIHQQRVPDADAIARRLLERNTSSNAAPPRVSSISALANASPLDPKSLSETNNGPTQTGTANTPVVSRFINNDGMNSKDGTPHEQSGFLKGGQGHSRTVSQVQTRKEQSDLYRNQSTPNFASQKSPTPSGSGAVTPDPALNQSRTQQKLWLQRGLSNIEASSQPHLPGLLPTGRAQAMRTPHAGKQFEFVDKEWAVVRRFQNPLDAGLDRLRRMNGGTLPGKPKQSGTNGTNGHSQRPSTSASLASKKSATTLQQQQQQQQKPRNHNSTSRKGRVSFHMGDAEGENEDDAADDHAPAERETPADIARRLWEHPIGLSVEG